MARKKELKLEAVKETYNWSTSTPVSCVVTIDRESPEVIDRIEVPVRACNEQDAVNQAKAFFEANYSGPHISYVIVDVSPNVSKA